MNFPYTARQLINKSIGLAKIKRFGLAYLLIMILPMVIAGCSGGDIPASPAGSSGSSDTSNGNTLDLNVSKTSILSNNSDSSIITATVVKDHVPQPNVTVNFVTTAGLINSASATTDSDGKATVTFKSGPRASNQIANVSATASGASASVSIQVSGNTIALSLPQGSMAIGATQTLTAKLEDAIPLGIYNASVTFTVVSGADVITLSNTTATSNYNGEALVSVTGVTAGSAIIMVSSLGASSQIGITIAAAAQVFEITSPATSPASLATDGSLIFKVNAPAQANVTFQSTIGAWNGSGGSVTVPVIAGVASATLTSVDTGLANVTVFDTAAPATKDTFQVNIYAPASQAANIILDATQFNLAISPAGISSKNSSTLTATVRTAPTATQPSGGVVGNAQVNFTLSNQPGGGEEVSPGTATTNSTGTITSTFSSGALETGGTGVRVTATVAGTSISDYVDIVITNRPGSITLGLSTKIIPSADNTSYSHQIRAQLADVGGNGVPNTKIYLKLWPMGYLHGYWAKDPVTDKCGYYYTNWPSDECNRSYYQPNEDLNMNLALDSGEDAGPMGRPDSFLTPPNTAAGTVPASVTTDANGVATFEITYLKMYATWVAVHLEASSSVQMTESKASLKWVLGVSTEDADACEAGGVFDSPFGYTSCN